MNDVKDYINKFKLEFFEFLKLHNRMDLKISDYIDEYEGVHFIFHNDKELEKIEIFKTFITDAIHKHFTINEIFNVCFDDDFILTDWSKAKTIAELLPALKLETLENSTQNTKNTITLPKKENINNNYQLNSLNIALN